MNAFGAFLEPLDDILSVADLAGGYQFRHLVVEGRPLIGKLTLDEAANGETARQDGPHDHRKLVGTGMLHGVVLRDRPHTGTRANSFSSGKTASHTCRPTFSK